MDRLVYLLSLTVSGIKNIENEISIKFYKKTIDKNFNPEYYKVKAIYGENGVGKSAIVNAVGILKNILSDETYLLDKKNQQILDALINKKTKELKIGCEFLLDFKDNNLVYEYELVLGKDKKNAYEMKSETIKCKNGNYGTSKYNKIFESNCGNIVFTRCDKDVEKIIIDKTKNLLNSSSIVPVFLDKVDDSNDLLVGYGLNFLMVALLCISIQVYQSAEELHEFYFLKKQLIEEGNKERLFDEYIKRIENSISINDKVISRESYDKYKKKVSRLTDFIRLFKKHLISIDIDTKDRGEELECELVLNYGQYSVNREFESTGIKKLISLFDCLSLASSGYIAFVDEIDSNLNDVYLSKLLEYFMYYSKGQLCFTTHNVNSMNVLQDNKMSIDFLSESNKIISWVSRGNSSAENSYINGMIEHIPFNISAADFIGVLGED